MSANAGGLEYDRKVPPLVGEREPGLQLLVQRTTQCKCCLAIAGGWRFEAVGKAEPPTYR